MGFGQFVDKNKMAADKLFPTKNCFSAFIKRDITKLEEDNLQQEFFNLARDKDCNRENYIANFEKDMDKISKHVASKYSSNGDVSYSDLSTPASISKLNIQYVFSLVNLFSCDNIGSLLNSLSVQISKSQIEKSFVGQPLRY